MKIAYCRVSTLEQNTARQEIAMNEVGVDIMFIEKASGKNTDRPELKKMLTYARNGDVLYIESISRLARSVKDLLNIVELLKAKNVGLISLKENFDTMTPQGKFMLTIFAALAELERETTLQRQAEGISAAKMAGLRFGRSIQVLPDNFKAVISEWKNGKVNAVEAMQKLISTRLLKKCKRGIFNLLERITFYKKTNTKGLTLPYSDGLSLLYSRILISSVVFG